MESAGESVSPAPNGESKHVLLNPVDLAQHVGEIGTKLEALTQRFEAHAEQEEDRAKRWNERLEGLTRELHKLGALPAFALPNLLAQGSEGQGPTGANALLMSAISGLAWMAWPKIQDWIKNRVKP